jgi:hypothetical protein
VIRLPTTWAVQSPPVEAIRLLTVKKSQLSTIQALRFSTLDTTGTILLCIGMTTLSQSPKLSPRLQIAELTSSASASTLGLGAIRSSWTFTEMAMMNLLSLMREDIAGA